MTQRAVPSQIDGVLDDAYVIPVRFVKIELDSGTVYLHTDLGTITALGQSWLGVGDLGAIGGIEEAEKTSPYSFAMTLSGIDSGLLTAALTEDYYERPCTVYLGFRNVITGALVTDEVSPAQSIYELAAGACDVMQIVDGDGETAIQLTVESELADWDEAPLEFYSNDQLQSENTGELLFEYMAELQNVKLIWGRGHRVSGRTGPSSPSRIFDGVNTWV